MTVTTKLSKAIERREKADDYYLTLEDIDCIIERGPEVEGGSDS